MCTELIIYAYVRPLYCITETTNRCALSLYGNQTGLNLYYDGTQVYMVVARTLTAFGSSYAPDHTHACLLCGYTTLALYPGPSAEGPGYKANQGFIQTFLFGMEGDVALSHAVP